MYLSPINDPGVAAQIPVGGQPATGQPCRGVPGHDHLGIIPGRLPQPLHSGRPLHDGT